MRNININQNHQRKRKIQQKMGKYLEDLWIYDEPELNTSDNHVDNGDGELPADPLPSLHPLAADFWLYTFQL